MLSLADFWDWISFDIVSNKEQTLKMYLLSEWIKEMEREF